MLRERPNIDLVKFAIALIVFQLGLTMSRTLEAADPYRELIAGQEERVLRFLRTYETFQEELHMEKLVAQRKALFKALDPIVPELRAELNDIQVPSESAAFNAQWGKILEHLENAYLLIMTSTPQQFIEAFLRGGREFAHGSYLLYALRAELPTVQNHWQLESATQQASITGPKQTKTATQPSVTHHRQTEAHAPYSLYVPEDYDPSQRWPLVVALHGSHGSGGEYLLTWLRAAKNHGYIVLAPQSLDVTWSIRQPAVDIRSVLSMLTRVAQTYSVDTHRMFVSGLSDGGTFTYALGLHCPDLFAGIAPIAAVLPPGYPLEEAQSLPIFMVHGVQDFIFPVATARATYARLQDSQFSRLTYTELPDWGHAYTYSINETRVTPWFTSIGDASGAVDLSRYRDAFVCPALD